MTSECPPEDELVRMVEGALGDASLAAIERHVDTCEQCAAVIAGLGALDSHAKRRVVGRYELDRPIGGGGMGQVWAAWDPQLRRDIAVKLVKPEHADDGRERERLLREARALARLQHPNVLAVYDVGEVDGEVFIATELVEGTTLASRGGANADWRALVKLYTQAARGLHAAHEVGLVHRDVKPANLLIGSDGRVRVADFGLAVKSATPSPVAKTELAIGSNDPQITQTGYIAGTPAYMAPEQRLGEPADARADQYALCIALAEAVAGRRPPLDIGTEAMIAFVAERRAREPELDALCAVIARGLSIDREDRFPDAGALADALDACVTSSSTQALVPPLKDAPRAVLKRRSRMTTIVVVGAAAAAAATAVYVVSELRVKPEATRDAAAITTAMPDGATTADAQLALAPADAARVAVAPITNTTGSGATKPPPTGDARERVDEALAAARRAILKRDGKSCLAALADLPATTAMMQRQIEFHRGQCELLAGDCDAGAKRIDIAMDGLGSPPNGEAMATLLCPIVGTYDVRFKRLIAQAHTPKTPAMCRPYLDPARKLAAETRNDRDKPAIGGVLRSLAACMGNGGDCVLAQTLWKQAYELDHVPAEMQIKGCTAPPGTQISGSAAIPGMATGNAVVALTEQLHQLQVKITKRDLEACKAFNANPPKDIPQGLETNVDLIHGYCEMIVGNCTAGSDLVTKVYNQAATTQATANTYCPVTGTLDQRLTRIASQLSAFADPRSAKQSIEWCSYLVNPAKIAAGEAQTDPQRKAAAAALQRIATCIAQAKRCTEANDLWALSVATDPNASAAPKLPGCP